MTRTGLVKVATRTGVAHFFACILLSHVTCALDVLETCRKECGLKLIIEEDAFNVACNKTCKVNQCQDGCERWSEAVASTCQNVCNDTSILRGKALFCIMGCNLAITTYLQDLRDEIGTPPAPYLVADSTTSDSVTIQWTPSPLQNVSYLVQWKFDSLPGDWEYYRPEEPLKVNRLQVKGLHPYTNYRFRIAWIVLPHYSPIISEESVVIPTLPYGVPSTPPTITSLSVVGPNQVSVSWDPPMFPNGPILSYTLTLKEESSGFDVIKEISDPKTNYFMFNNLRPETTYIISVTTTNVAGQGPADIRNVTTLHSFDTSGTHLPEPFLILGAKRSVLKQGLHNLITDRQIVYEVDHDDKSTEITGIALHVKYELLYVSDSTGSIHKVSLANSENVTTIVSKSQDKPGILSVDWLNNLLYMVEENQISRCDLNGKNLNAVVSGFDHRPTDMQVDPANGYLYWVLNGGATGGLYRIDLKDIENGVIFYQEAQNISKDSKLTTFAIDHKNYRLLLPKSSNNTIISVTLDGSDAIDIRTNSQTAHFNELKSIAMHNGLFYWTTGSKVYGEEYLPQEDKYYHNAYYLLQEVSFSSVKILHIDSQPTPVPVNPVDDVQAVFLDDTAKIAWSKPKLLGGLGKGAWQKWLYEVDIFDHVTKITIFRRDINDTSYTFHNLHPKRPYSIKVGAYSVGGKGPWSSQFTGQTLKQATEVGLPFILWSAQEGLMKSDAVGDNVQSLIHIMNLDQSHITDICWYNEILFLNTNASWVYTYNLSTHHSLALMHNISNAASITVEWLAPKIYWSNPVQQMISRANLDGSLAEPLPILTLAHELAVDSLGGHLYWATGHSVEFAFLNGAGRQTYFQTGLFSGKQVMGLTLDFDNYKLYWMVRSYEGSILFKASLASSHGGKDLLSTVELIGPLPENDVRGPLWYFSNRLFWAHEYKDALISDMVGSNVAVLKGLGLQGLHTLAVVDASLHPYPDGLNSETVSVVPNYIMDSLINIEGTWENFNITWETVKNVNYGNVFYEVSLEDGHKTHSIITDEAKFSYPAPKQLPPYSELRIAIRACTYWGSSKQTVKTLYSPMSIPTKPLHPRVFTSYKINPLQNIQEINGEFRWSAPEHANGIIEGYIVNIWTSKNGRREFLHNNAQVSNNTLKFHLKNLVPKTVYYCEVIAYTQMGKGPASDVVEARTSEEHPVPKLLVAKTDAVKLTDIDTREEKLLTSKASHPIAVTYLSHEGRVFWLEEDGALMASNIDGSNITLVKNLPAYGTSMSIDWIGRYLYWTEANHIDRSSTIWELDLNSNSNPKLIIMRNSSIITSVEVEPFQSKLIWTEMQDNSHGVLQTSTTEGNNLSPFFPSTQQIRLLGKRSAQRIRQCNCQSRPSVGRTITIDRSDPSKPELLWVDGRHGHILASDYEGCNCRLVVNATEAENNGLPPTSLTADKNHIYWSNASTGQVYSIKKNPDYSVSISSKRPPSASFHRKHIISETVKGIRDIRAIGDHLQPYPDKECLVPPLYSSVPKLIDRQVSSLTLEIPPVVRPTICNRITLASVMYTVYYGKMSGREEDNCDISLKGCKEIQTYNNTVTLHGLDPFANYTIRVSASNYYTQGKGVPGPAVIYQTKEGAPSAPVNITVDIVTPFRADVHWQPPIVPNGDPIRYEVRWHMGNNLHSAVYTASPETSGNHYVMSLASLAPSTTYFILVRAYSSGGDMYSDSAEKVVTTYDLPGNFSLMETTSRSLVIGWRPAPDNSILEHQLEYCEVGRTDWIFVAKQSTQSDSFYNFTIEELRPKTDYEFRLLLTYPGSKTTFIWPHDFKFVFQTLGDCPEVPGPPEVRNIGKDVYKVMWNEVPHNGGIMFAYELQQRTHLENGEIEGWTTVYNNSNNQWLIEDLPSKNSYIFRVRAMNEYGSSNFSAESKPYFIPEPGALIGAETDHKAVIMGSILAFITLVTAPVLAFYCIRRHRNNEKKALQNGSGDLHPTDLELATLRELPRHGNFVHQNNALYAMSIPTDAELAALPHIRREQITLTKFLGSGAFGEVFEGIAHNLGAMGVPPIKVAIKTLRKGATEQEKSEFLKEAKLMSNFKHDHILKLLGICLDNNPNFLILELMEGGDLLTFLRANRPSGIQQNSLTLDDLLCICLDVAKGCKYLEELHFVHRDLAARNCLVSSLDPANRIVKIGDFGLARDIYKHDYYRKEGEGLLPVRWMAPESLVDGIFSNQSDVWSFGVLLWEVMTFGQQPYPARTNLEVLHYVRQGGRLDKPENCPDELFDLMNLCWSYAPDNRPTFNYCLQAVQEVRSHLNSIIPALTAVHNHNYIFSGGFDNLGYREDDQRQNSTVAEMKANGNMQPRAGPVPLATFDDLDTISIDSKTQLDNLNMNMASANPRSTASPQDEHWYLEILADDVDVKDVNGYEMPLPSLPPAALRQKKRQAQLNYTEVKCARSPSSCSTSSHQSGTNFDKTTDALTLQQPTADTISNRKPSQDGMEETRTPSLANKTMTNGKVNTPTITNNNNNNNNANSTGSSTPLITAALLKTTSCPISPTLNVSPTKRSLMNGDINCNTSFNPMNIDQAIDSEGEDDRWSLSTASLSFHSNEASSVPSSQRNSGISSLSAVSGVEVDYIPKSSWC